MRSFDATIFAIVFPITFVLFAIAFIIPWIFIRKLYSQTR